MACKRFRNDDAHPGFRGVRMRQPCAAKLLDDVRINFGGRRKVKQAVAAGGFCSFQFRQALGKVRGSFWVGVIPRTVIKVGSEFAPLLWIYGPDFWGALCRLTPWCPEGV